jgi:hypothetical protein
VFAGPILALFWAVIALIGAMGAFAFILGMKGVS